MAKDVFDINSIDISKIDIEILKEAYRDFRLVPTITTFDDIDSGIDCQTFYIENLDAIKLKHLSKNSEVLVYENTEKDNYPQEVWDRKEHIDTPIEVLFENIVDKFLESYSTNITIVMPICNPLISLIAETIQRKVKNCKIIKDCLRKLTTNEVWEALDAIDSPFRKRFGKTRHDWETAMRDMKLAFNKMNIEENGNFTYHLLPPNDEYREFITLTLSCDEFSRGKYVNEFYDHNILLLEESTSNGFSVRDIQQECEVLNSFQPKSITVLTMLINMN